MFEKRLSYYLSLYALGFSVTLIYMLCLMPSCDGWLRLFASLERLLAALIWPVYWVLHISWSYGHCLF